MVYKSVVIAVGGLSFVFPLIEVESATGFYGKNLELRVPMMTSPIEGERASFWARFYLLLELCLCKPTT